MDSSKTIAIFEANPPSPVFENKSAQASWFADILAGIDPKLTVRTYRVFSNEFPVSLDSIDGIIVTGSSKEVYDGDSWITTTAGWVKQAQRQGIPVLGVCFGHQIIAQAFGGTVTPNPKGREMGTCSISLVDAAAGDPLFRGLPKTVSVQESHKSAVVKLPKAAKVLGENKYGVQAFRMGEDKTWGVQFHPELDAEVLKKVVEYRKDILREEGLDAQKIAQGIHPTQQARGILKNFLDIVYENTKS
ncbi:hypothetical protein A2Z00_02665 [Candidatus Gottesmanbacteria bacterium RBG_13_45_10]|uniref:Glutamine amidotransferase domain-containing protein n=1 Tax=Candidatus Gottesmanbacteria bacterium RBG_13_45_10 TaxID=1798370 RepID=A0A1F5ZGK3_9BACT|nr:MAG: hypothetical protein A2Z00_02665 [Candidatus Gottesmanbacteria bacterium RBG_13_45_10]